MKLLIPVHREEAAFGAALTGMTAAGLAENIEQAQKLISYE
jgi:ribulose kinase